MYDFLSERIPTIGYTDNNDVNLFIAAKRMYIDAYAHCGQHLDKNLREDFVQHISPVMSNFALGSPDNYRYGRREETLSLLGREMNRVMEYLEDKYLGSRNYELWVNDKPGAFFSTENCGRRIPEGKGLRREILGDREPLLEKHRALMQHLSSAKESLQELGAEEDVKLVEEIIKRLSNV